MRGRILLLGAAFLLSSTAAGAQPLPADPPQDAIEVARVILATTAMGRYPEPVESVESGLQNALLAGGNEPPCDRANPQCLAAAQAVAREFAPQVVRLDQLRSERLTAFGLLDRLGPDRLARIAAFLRGDDGRALAAALQTPWAGAPSSCQRGRDITSRAGEHLPDPEGDADRAFRERTAGLPRTREPRPMVVRLEPAPPC